MDIDWPTEFGDWLERLETDARNGDARARRTLVYVTRALDYLNRLQAPPRRDQESATLKWVRQSRRYPLWRVSHSFHPDIAFRLICWFPPGDKTAVVTVFGGDKRKIGDVFYDGVASRADPLIDQWKRETDYQEAS